MSSRGASTAGYRLLTLSPSHYCEKARWALERAGVAYVEERHAPLFHIPFTFAAKAKRTVPVLVGDGLVLSDSTDILELADSRTPEGSRLFPTEPVLATEVRALEELYDRRLGTNTRAFLYAHVLVDRALVLELLDVGLSPLESRAFRAASPAIVALMKRAYPTTEEARQRRFAAVTSLFEDASDANVRSVA
ncbi:glutathione S-transferase, partial [bacterium]